MESIACLFRYTSDPSANPYVLEFAIVLGLLCAVFAVWRHERPRPRFWLRLFVGSAACVTFLTVVIRCCVHSPALPEPSLMTAVHAAMFIAAGLLLEITLSREDPVPTARIVSSGRTARRS